MVTLKCRGDTPIQKLAGAIANNLRSGNDVCVSVIGAPVLNQAIKAVIVARKYLKKDENPFDLVVQPSFEIKSLNDKVQNYTLINLNIYKTDYVEEKAVNDDYQQN